MKNTHLTRGAASAALLALAASVWAPAAHAAPAASAATPIRVPTIEQLAAFPALTGFQLSPDGKHLIAIASEGDTRSILVWKTDAMKAKPTVIGATSMQIQSASFLKNDRLQVMLTQPYDLRDTRVIRTFISKLMITDLQGKDWVEPMATGDMRVASDLRKYAQLSNPTVLSRLPNDPDLIVLASDANGIRNETRDIFRYNVHTGASQRLMRLGENDGNVWVDGKGQPFARSRFDTDSEGVYIAIDFRNKDGGWDEHFRNHVKTRDVVDVVAPGGKPGTAVILSNLGHEFAGLYEYDIGARKTTATLFEHKYFDAIGVRSLRADGSPSDEGFDGFSFQGAYGPDEVWADPTAESVVQGVAKALGIAEIKQELVAVAGGAKAQVRSLDGVTVRLVQYVGGDAPAYIVRVSGRAWPTEHYLLRAGALQLLGREYPAIDKRALGHSALAYYPARDGLNIPAYLALPNPELCGPGPYAAVIHPHGGPWARDTMGYDTSGWVPLLVSQCRVVLQPQYRGSDGWGRTLWFAGDREWGQKMQDDKDDGAKWLVERKLADPKRIAMFGFSYGGYAAFAASVRPNGLYKCAIAGAGVSDIERIWAGFFENPYFQQHQEPTVRGLSPLSKADKIEIPIMVYHGDRDQTVPIVQSQMFVDKAKSAGKPVEYHVLADYAHGPAWTRKTMAEQLGLIDSYLKTGCGGGGL